MRKRCRVFVAAATVASVAFAACVDEDPPLAPRGVGVPDGSADTGAGEGGGGDASDGAVTTDVCALERQHAVDCKLDLECGADKFDAWCKDLDAKTNSLARRDGERKCLSPKNCLTRDLRDCIYKSYAQATRSSAQEALLGAYCQTCFPADVAGCKTASVAYDVTQGPAGVTDVFLAVWELSDALTDKVRASCTGGALTDAGAGDAGDGGDAGFDCVKAFASCAGGFYIDALPDCPK
jgi:hypothetical protein